MIPPLYDSIIIIILFKGRVVVLVVSPHHTHTPNPTKNQLSYRKTIDVIGWLLLSFLKKINKDFGIFSLSLFPFGASIENPQLERTGKDHGKDRQ